MDEDASAAKISRRSKRRDGLANRIEFFVLTNFRPLWRLIQLIPPIERRVNKLLINRAIYKAPVRPYALSSRSDYSSWDSLVDRTYSGRHLPPASKDYLESLPPVAEVANLFRRPAHGLRLCEKSTVLFGNFAQWFTDGFLRTDRNNHLKNTSNHEIDLSPLYGRTKAVGDALREGKGGRLKSQWIDAQEFPPYYFDENLEVRPEFADVANELYLPKAEEKLRDHEPERIRHRFAMGVERANNHVGYVMFNVLFLREHNRLCQLLAAANPDWNNDDERLYQTARNIVIAMVIRIVVEEYINHIAPFHFQFRAQPNSFYGERWYRTNWMTVEFNLLYRWHGLVPDYIRLGGQDVPLSETLFNNKLLIDHGLGNMFDSASRQKAGKIGLFNTNDHLVEEAEIPSIEIGRQARLRSYNEYREYAGFPRVTDFDQITGDQKVQKELRRIYQDVDHIEFFVGLFAEDVRPRSALPGLIGRLVAIDAFSQALTNPLLSEHVYRRETFAQGWDEIAKTSKLSDVVHRNTQGGEAAKRFLVTMTQLS